ncbi:von Willebrand factor D and EGF domain-containing protein-like [Dreissena polymorpha]|nr:von Willebrand factor D and EGF domain-containing protein-like [Dreissena polymorpha]
MMTERHLKAPTYFGLGVTIACSITASIDPATPESAPVISPERFCGIRALNRSSHVAIHNDKGAEIYYELTIPFGCEQGFESDSFCYLDVILFIPQSTTNCNKPDAIQRNSETNSCGLRFYRSDIGKPKKLFVQAKFPHPNAYLSQQMILTLTTVNNLAHPFFNGYAVDKVQVTVSTDQAVINNKGCYAVCDPHMMSFDGLGYEHHLTGTFDMYIHQNNNQKIQIMTQPCFNNGQTPHCVCGVAVQAGSDVVVISTCARVLDIRFIQCGDGILREKVNEVSKTKYRVTLPSGSYVDISLVYEGFLMNVHVTPSVADFNKTSGLCGSFDGNINNDRLKRPGSTDNDPNRSWMVQAKDNLFNENVVLSHWEDQYRFCTCDSKSVKPTYTATCDVETKKICDVKPVFKDRCVDKKRRKRRSGNGKYKPTDEGDFHQTVKLAFVSKYRDHFNQRQHRSIKQYTEETARQDCMQLLNTTAFQKCSNVPGLDFTATINDCILDAQITGTMEWTLSHLETIKSICIQQIDTQKLPPKEDLVGITVTINGSSFSNLSDENASLPLTVFTDEIFEEIQSVSCPHECSGFGICVNGSCICEKDHIGEDCSLDSTRPPEMIGIPDEGFCDLKERACKKTSVFGDNLIFENQVKCNIEPFEINVRNDILSEEKYQVTGVPQTFMEVSCPLEPSKKRSIDGGADINDIIARAYNISLSNDGLNFSEEDTFLVYDSACVTCSKTSGAIRCLKQSGLCMTDGECYGPGDTLGCYTCAVSGAGSAVWQPGPDCSKPSNDRPNSGGEQITAEYTVLLAFLAVAFGL